MADPLVTLFLNGQFLCHQDTPEQGKTLARNLTKAFQQLLDDNLLAHPQTINLVGYRASKKL